MKTRVILPTLYPAQHAAIFSEARYSLIEASTKAGKTFGCMIWQMSRVLSVPGEHWWIAPTKDVSGIAYKRCVELTKDIAVKTNDSKYQIFFPNGSVWWFRGSDNTDSLYGEDVQSVVIDEASRCKDGVWPAVRSIITSTRAPVRMIGNVRGRKNWFWKLCRKAEQKQKRHTQGGKRWRHTKLTAYDAVAGGVLANAEVEDARESLDKAVFEELYLAIESDAASSPFGSALERRKQVGLAPGPAVAFGVDVAKKLDFMVIIGLNAKGEVCHFERFNQMTYPNVVARIKTVCGDVRTYIDATGVGEPVVDFCQAEMMACAGFMFTPSSRVRLFDGLQKALQSNQTSILEGDCYDELDTFEYSWTKYGKDYRQLEGVHDDCACAHALAVAAMSLPIIHEAPPALYSAPQTVAQGMFKQGW